MPGPVFLDGDRIELRTIDEEDLPFLHEHVNDPRVWLSLGLDGPVNDEQGEQWFEEHVSKDDTISFLVAVDGEPAGTINAFDVSERHGHATLGCWLATDFQGRGYGSDATRTLLAYLFDQRRMQGVVAYVFGFNEASMGLMDSIGMERVGTLPDWIFADGRHWDAHLDATTADSWDRPTTERRTA